MEGAASVSKLFSILSLESVRMFTKTTVLYYVHYLQQIMLVSKASSRSERGIHHNIDTVTCTCYKLQSLVHRPLSSLRVQYIWGNLCNRLFNRLLLPFPSSFFLPYNYSIVREEKVSEDLRLVTCTCYLSMLAHKHHLLPNHTFPLFAPPCMHTILCIWGILVRVVTLTHTCI